MYAVAITELVTSPDDAAGPLAALLGKTAYDMRLELAAGVPAVIATTPDKTRAAEIAAHVRSQRHEVVAFDTAAVVASDDMVSMKRFRFDSDGIGLDDRAGELLPYDDVLVLLRGVHRFDSEKTAVVTTKKLSGARAIATGGLFVTKSSTERVRSVMHEKCGVLYVFRRTGKKPWILRETGTNYAGLGAAITPTQVTNFNTTVQLMRERMPSAPFDDRLTTLRRIRSGEAVSRPGISVESSSVPWTDLLAHVLAYAVSRRSLDPYRT